MKSSQWRAYASWFFMNCTDINNISMGESSIQQSAFTRKVKGWMKCVQPRIIAERIKLRLEPQNITVTPEHQLKDSKSE